MVEKGKRYIFERRSKNGTIRFTADVTWVQRRDGFLYFGYVPTDLTHGKFGAARLYPPGKKPYGMRIITLVGDTPEAKPARFKGPRPGDRGYDLLY